MNTKAPSLLFRAVEDVRPYVIANYKPNEAAGASPRPTLHHIANWTPTAQEMNTKAQFKTKPHSQKQTRFYLFGYPLISLRLRQVYLSLMREFDTMVFATSARPTKITILLARVTAV